MSLLCIINKYLLQQWGQGVETNQSCTRVKTELDGSPHALPRLAHSATNRRGDFPLLVSFPFSGGLR